jgi:acyl-CoA hydrolase
MDDMIKKTPSDSQVIMTELVLPNDTNTLNNLMGGKLLHWMDIAAAITAQRHSNNIVVTASVDNVSFTAPIRLGNVVTMTARITRSFRSSMEVYIEVTAEDIPKRKKISSNKAFYTFVAVNDAGGTVTVPEILPETDEEKEMYQGALRRRQLRLVLAKKMKPSEATELKSLFIDE